MMRPPPRRWPCLCQARRRLRRRMPPERHPQAAPPAPVLILLQSLAARNARQPLLHSRPRPQPRLSAAQRAGLQVRVPLRRPGHPYVCVHAPCAPPQSGAARAPPAPRADRAPRHPPLHTRRRGAKTQRASESNSKSESGRARRREWGINQWRSAQVHVVSAQGAGRRAPCTTTRARLPSGYWKARPRTARRKASKE
jgi:hypothetical protein